MDFFSITMQWSASKRFFLSAFRSLRGSFVPSGIGFAWPSYISGSSFQMQFDFLTPKELGSN
ncbi:hypothetical protein CIK59_07030 [Brevibacterium aurantiacum]|uniref:Uncharacterized protein n=1 Tax=Brevibacterium aurantiacum TaxID=273384 RepID=A0A2A3ZRL3_BREAU|nr:hypothetical protein CIK59_07030 [Brevibacterium aurantiacum]RCS89348.1 hypothetical protein CIK63_09360 [Brevibacterium aurantiacum]